MKVDHWVSCKLFSSLALCLALGVVLLGVLFFIATSSFAVPAAFVYALWLFFDSKTPYTIGRSSSWVRKNVFWTWVRAYFPQKLVITGDLPTNSNYLFCLFPHGIFSTAAFAHFFSETSDFFNKYPHMSFTPVTLSINFYVPFVREILLAAGACSCSEESILYKLTEPKGGNGVLLVPGGSAEALVTKYGSYNIVLNQRKGFIRLAHKAGASVVPTFAFGETRAYGQINFPRESLLFKLQEWIRRVTGIAPCLFYGRSALFSFIPGIFPMRTPVTTVVGAPIHMEKISSPSQEVIDRSHKKFVQALVDLFEQHKWKYLDNPHSVHLNIM